MAALGYIEILDGKGEVTERIGVESLPIHIGRAYSNQVIVGDPYVCPVHLVIAPDEQGRLIARDLNSVNGLFDGSRGARVTTLEIHSGAQFRIGHTSMRYCSVDHPLAPTAIDQAKKDFWLWSPYAAVASSALVLAMLCLESFLSSVERVKFANIVIDPLVTLTTMFGWAGAWALAGRIVVSRFHFAPHVLIAGVALLGFILLSAAFEWLEFFIPFVRALRFSGFFTSGLTLATLVFLHLGFSSPLRRRSRLGAALLVSAGVVGTNALSDFTARSKFSTVMEYTGIIKPVDAALLPATSVEQFFADSQNLKIELDRLAHKAKATQP